MTVTRLLILIGGGAFAIVTSTAAIGMLREQLHVGCAYGTVGEAAGTWTCSDGIGYIFPGLTLLFGSVLSLLVALVVLLAARRERTRRRALTALAFAPLLWSISWLSAVTAPRTDPLPAGETWMSVWLMNVGISGLLGFTGALIATFARPVAGSRRSVDGRVRVQWLLAGALLLAASAAQVGLLAAIGSTTALLTAGRLGAPSAPADAPAGPGAATAG